MSRTYRDITWTVGNTPMVELDALSMQSGNSHGVPLLGKLEYLSPSGSNKDRGVLGMLDAALREGLIQQGSTVVECSAGDLGIALAMHGRARGLNVVVTLPECMASSRCDLVRALGAELVFTESREGIRGALARAEGLAKEREDAICLQPFTNRANAAAHENGTAAEIWRDTDGELGAVVCGIGTGGTAAGCASFFAKHAPHVRIYGVEPAGSPVVSGGEAGPHNIPGLGAGFVPAILGPSDLAGTIPVQDSAAVSGVQELARSAALCAGPASGAIAHAAMELVRRDDHSLEGRPVVAILPDSGERYVEHPAYQNDPWKAEQE